MRRSLTILVLGCVQAERKFLAENVVGLSQKHLKEIICNQKGLQKTIEGLTQGQHGPHDVEAPRKQTIPRMLIYHD